MSIHGRSYHCGTNVDPNWKKTSWIPGITELIGLNPDYTENSFKGELLLWYKNDLTGKYNPQGTVYWVFSKTGIQVVTLDRLDIPNQIGSGQ